MGCRACGSASVPPPNTVARMNPTQQAVVGPCDYNIDRLKDMNARLVWFKSKGLFVKYNVTSKKLNQYIGIVLTSLNINNKCTYKNILDEASNLVDLIISIQENV